MRKRLLPRLDASLLADGMGGEAYECALAPRFFLSVTYNGKECLLCRISRLNFSS